MNRRPIVWTAILSSALGANLAAAEAPITTSNWQSHPRIEEIRKVVKEVEEDAKAGKLTCTSKELENEWPGEDSKRELCLDSTQVPRRFLRQGGSEDSAATRTFYYEKQGRLRFLFVSAGAVNGTRMEYRIYFDESGRRMWEAKKQASGPGYTFPESWPEADFVYKPKELFGPVAQPARAAASAGSADASGA